MIRLLLLLLAAGFFTLSSSSRPSNDEEELQCVYTVYIRTGSIIKGGTDAKIGLSLGDAAGPRLTVDDLVSWGGLMGPAHDYFERGSLDAFSGRGPCGLIATAPLCSLNLTSDGGGSHHGWFCEYVEVTATGPHVPCEQTRFHVQQWLANDAPPYQLYANVDACRKPELMVNKKRHLVIHNNNNNNNNDGDSSSSTTSLAI